MSRLDWTDATEVTIWLAGLRQSFDDLDGAASDMLRPLHKRRLGAVTHASICRGARAQIRQMLDFATPAPEPSDPAGSGSSPAE